MEEGQETPQENLPQQGVAEANELQEGGKAKGAKPPTVETGSKGKNYYVGPDGFVHTNEEQAKEAKGQYHKEVTSR